MGSCDPSAMTADQEQALKQWMGKTFTQVDQLNKHWNTAVTEERQEGAKGLQSDRKTNQSNREQLFDPTRNRFWRRVYKDKDGARKLLEDSGATFTKSGNAPQMTINGKSVSLDVDHAIGLANDPSKMLDPNNLRLISAPENKPVLEAIKREDPFQSEQAADRWIKNQKSAKGKPCKP
jgi:hypothetical protein